MRWGARLLPHAPAGSPCDCRGSLPTTVRTDYPGLLRTRRKRSCLGPRTLIERCSPWPTREAHVDQPDRIWGRAALTGSATWCSSGQEAPARPPWWRRCSPLRGPSPGPGPSATAPPSATSTRPSSKHGRSDLPRRRAAWCTARPRSTSSTPPGTPTSWASVRAGLRAADCALFVIAANDGVDDGDPRPVARVRRRRDAAGRGDHQARPGPRRLRRRARPGAGGVRRQGDAALRPRSATDGEVTVADRAARRRATAAYEDLRGSLIEGVIEESEDETLMDRYLGGEEIDADGADRRPREGRRPRDLLPRRPGLLADRRRLRRAARPGRDRLPVAAGAPVARRLHARGRGGRRDRRATPTARSWPRSSRRPATRTSAG